MTELETAYVAWYQAVPCEGEPLRVDLGDGFDIPNDISNEEEIRKALGPMRRGKVPGPSGIQVNLLKMWCTVYEVGVALEKGGYATQDAVFEGTVNWMLAVVRIQNIFTTQMVP